MHSNDPCLTLHFAINLSTGCEACTTSRPDDYVIPPPGPLDTLPRTTGPVAPPVPATNPPEPKETKVKNGLHQPVGGSIGLGCSLLHFDWQD